MGRYFSKIQIMRPLVFLCGPFVDDENARDRRNILQKYIAVYHKETDPQGNIYQPIPVIIDKVLKQDYLRDNNLSLWLFEEMIASVSFKTYIFLDTMSTSAELGLFSNSSTGNKVTIFTPRQEILHIGSFIKDNLANNEHIVCVPYESENLDIINKDNPTTTHREAFFSKDEIPGQIKEAIDIDMDSIFTDRQTTNLKVTYNQDQIKELNQIDFNVTEENVDCRLKFKLLFYLVTTVLKGKYRALKKLEISSEVIDFVESQVKMEIFNIFLNHPNLDEYSSIRAKSIIKKPFIEISTEIHFEIHDLIVNVLHFAKLIETEYEGYWGTVKVIDTESLVKENRRRPLASDFQFKEFFLLTNDDEELIKSYNNNPNKYVYKFYMKQNGKMKTIITYRNDQNGRMLRKIHEKINHTLIEVIPSSISSFAYKKGMSIVSCFPSHLDSSCFYKVDVTKFFDSIRISNLIRVFKCFFSTSPETFYQTQIRKISGKDAETNSGADMKEIEYYDFDFGNLYKLFGLTFYKGKLPIGFITSPKISDIYMYFLDCKLSAESFAFSRYADDILISDKSEENLDSTYNVLLSELRFLNLSVNKSKLTKKRFNERGESMRFLGLNIVYSNEGNRITVSRKDLLEIVNAYGDFVSRPSEIDYHKVKGRISYVKYVCPLSYQKLTKMVFVRTKTDLDLFMNHNFLNLTN